MKKGLKILICLVLCVCTLSQTVFAVMTKGATAVSYISDVQLIYANSLEEAQEKLPEGYKLYEHNINAGASDLGVYLCYTTTTEISAAITDIRLMNEMGGFDRGTFNDKMDEALEALDEQAQAIYSAIVNEYIPNLNNGLPGAKYAHDQLNIFMIDDENHLGDYIKEGKLTSSDISKMLLVCHNTIISSILSLIAQGLQRKDGEDWLDKLEELNPDDYEMNAELQLKYADMINKLQPPLSQFSDQYNIMVYTDDVRDSMTAEQIELYAEDLADEETVNWWYSLWDILNSHPLAGDSGLTAESVLVEWYLGESVANHKICMLIDSMTEGQRTLVSLVGPINFILSDLFTEQQRLDAEEVLADIKAENGTISVWDGINHDIFDVEVGITSVAYDEMVTSNNYDIFTDESRVLTKSAQDYVALVTNYSSIIFAGISILSGASMLAKGYSGSFFLFKALSHVGAFLAKGLIASIASYAPLVVLGACLIASLIIWIINEIEAGKPPVHDRTTIPKYMVDSITDNSGAQRYEIYKLVGNVQSDDELKKESDYGIGDVKNMSGSDVNANKGYHWAALYVSSNAAVGNPIEEGFIISEAVDAAPEGYIPLRHFNKKSEAVNLNAVDSYEGEDEALYLYYKGTRLPENHTVYKYVRNLAVVSVDLREPTNPDKYRFSSEQAFDVAKKELTEIGMFPINYDFSDDSNIVTLIGWSGTDSEEYAVKDIRLVYKSSVGRAGSGIFGTVSYGNIGTFNDWSLFICRGDQSEAPPIKALKLVAMGEDPATSNGISINANKKDSTLDTENNSDWGAGWEAVNEFTGGPAVPMGKSGVQLYFMPETPFVEGPDYVAGIEFDSYITNYSYKKSGSYYDQHVENCCHVDIWGNDPVNYYNYKKETLGELFFEGSSFENYVDMYAGVSFEDHHSSNDGNPGCEYTTENGWDSHDRKTPRTYSAVKYYLTKNPYRAIYGVATRLAEDNVARESFVSYAQLGYALAPAEVTISMSNVEIDAFKHKALVDSGKTFRGKELVLKDNEYHSDGIAVNLDITQSNFGKEYVTWNTIYVMGYSSDRTPLTVEDFIFSRDMLHEDAYPDNFIPIPYMGGDGTQYSVIAPFNENVACYIDGNSSINYAGIFPTFYGYVRSEREVDEVVTGYIPGAGKYISALYLASKEDIRVSSLLPNDKDAKCEHISYRSLETQLLQKGATSTFNVNIGTDYYSDGNNNANTVYLGYSRTDDAKYAIRDIRFYVCDKGETPPKTMNVKLDINGKEQIVEYVLVDNISLTSKANLDCKKELNGKGMEVLREVEKLSERQAYLYVTTNGTAFPDPITDIKVTTWCTPGSYEAVMSTEGKSFYTVKNESKVNLHIKNKWFEEGNFFAFKRESNNDLYISEITINNGDDRTKVITELIENGYSVINSDMNRKAAGDHIFIGVKYTDNKEEAITDIRARHGKNPKDSYPSADNTYEYKLAKKIDLNKGAGGDYIYLFYTKDPLAGEPILDLYGESSVQNFSDSRYKHTTVKKLNSDSYSNLNEGTTVFTGNVYLVMKRITTAGKYISSVYVAYGWTKGGAIEKLQNNGYTEYIDKDLNDGTGSSQYIYMGYKRTDNPDEAITDILFLTYGDGELETVEFNGITYKLASNVNLNRHCTVFAADIFMYYTTDKAAGEPLTALYCVDKPVEMKVDELGYHRTAKGTGYGTFEDGYMDLNTWAMGDYIYLVLVSAPPTVTVVGSIFSEGSWISIITLSSILIAVAVGVAFYVKNKKEKEAAGEGGLEEKVKQSTEGEAK